MCHFIYVCVCIFFLAERNHDNIPLTRGHSNSPSPYLPQDPVALGLPHFWYALTPPLQSHVTITHTTYTHKTHYIHTQNTYFISSQTNPTQIRRIITRPSVSRYSKTFENYLLPKIHFQTNINLLYHVLQLNNQLVWINVYGLGIVSLIDAHHLVCQLKHD